MYVCMCNMCIHALLCICAMFFFFCIVYETVIMSKKINVIIFAGLVSLKKLCPSVVNWGQNSMEEV